MSQLPVTKPEVPTTASRFLNLPAELRFQILEDALQVDHGLIRTSDNGHQNSLQLGILRVNRQIAREAIDTFTRINTFSIHSVDLCFSGFHSTTAADIINFAESLPRLSVLVVRCPERRHIEDMETWLWNVTPEYLVEGDYCYRGLQVGRVEVVGLPFRMELRVQTLLTAWEAAATGIAPPYPVDNAGYLPLSVYFFQIMLLGLQDQANQNGEVPWSYLYFFRTTVDGQPNSCAKLSLTHPVISARFTFWLAYALNPTLGVTEVLQRVPNFIGPDERVWDFAEGMPRNTSGPTATGP